MSEAPAKGVDEKYCSECGTVIKARAEICPNCGVRQMPPPMAPAAPGSGRNRVVAALLAFFLGGLGAHKFYLGQVGKGFLYLLFCWTFIPSIIAFVEFIILLTMPDETFQQKYG